MLFRSSRFIGSADSPGSLRSVQHDGERGALELIAKFTAALGQRDGRRESLELEGDAINLVLVAVHVHVRSGLSDADAAQDDLVRGRL